MGVSPRDNSYTVKTILRQISELQSAVDAAFTPLPQTTLNYKYQIQHLLTPSRVPVLKYFGIGINGCYNVDDKNLAAPYNPNMLDMDLYQPIPFRIVPVDEDLTAAERKNYRMRYRQTFHGQDYFCYYLKVLEPVDTTTKVVRVNPVSKYEEPFELETAHLTPTPVIPSTNGADNSTTVEVDAYIRTRLTYTAAEVYEAIGVMFQGDLRYARISEIGIYQGEDRTVTGYDVNNAAFQYDEAIYTQLAFKTCNTGVAMTSAAAVTSHVLSLESGSLVVL